MTFGWRTEPEAPVRNAERLALAAILALGVGLRLRHIDFGLPALNDPDEPVFIMTALDMLREGRLDPGWFGHPATLLFYLLALVIAAVGAAGLALGRWASTNGFVAAVFADPGTVVLPMRLLMAAFGVASLGLTWRIGRRVGGPATGLVAALLLSVNALHVELSQVIRTDMLATLLMNWSMLHALAILHAGRTRDHVWAGVAAGLAGATKWPALLVLAAPVLAGLSHSRTQGRGRWRVLLAPPVACATLLLVSPYLLLDWQTVVHDLAGEARPVHPGATGHGLIGNLAWYVRHPLLDSFGVAGLALVGFGALAAARNRAGAWVLLPTAALLAVALSAQSLVWARWILPLLPVLAVLGGLGVVQIAARVRVPRHRRLATALVLVLLVGIMGHRTLDRQAIRSNDPRQLATQWVRRHLPPGRSVLVEHAAFDLLPYPGTLRFPLGSAGCVDARTLLKTAPSHRRVNTLRDHRAIVDIGHVDAAAIPSCRADVLILSNYARYCREPLRFPAELANYRRVATGYRRVATFHGLDVERGTSTVALYARGSRQGGASGN